MNALAYFECSARDSLGVDAVFDITVDLLIRQRRGQIIKTPFPGLKLDDNAGAAPNNDMKGTVGVNNNGDRKKTGRRTSKLLCFA